MQAAFPGAGPPGAGFDRSVVFMKVLRMVADHGGSSESEANSDISKRFNEILQETVEAMEEAGIRYVFIGGIASGGLGRPRSTHDIDLFVVPEEAEMALKALAKHGFQTEKTDPHWLFKGKKNDILVDIIFKSKGEIYLDQEMYQKMITAEFHGKRLRLVAPEDLLIIKAAAHSELTPSHWHDAIALLSYANIDWNYLVKRARRAPRRILSLLLYAQSSDIWVPNHVIHELYTGVFGNSSRHFKAIHGTTSVPSSAEKEKLGRGASLMYAVAHLREKLAEDPRTNDLTIQIETLGDKILLQGEVQQEDRKQIIEQIAKEVCPNFGVENQIQVVAFNEPDTNLEDVG